MVGTTNGDKTEKVGITLPNSLLKQTDKRVCPLCGTEMERPRKGFCIGDTGKDPVMTIPCSHYHPKGGYCDDCKRYFDYECSRCGILFFFRLR